MLRTRNSANEPRLTASAAITSASTIRAFDHVVTAPTFAYASAEDYYAKATAAPDLHRIAQPTLLLSAVRSAIGASGWLMPKTAARLFGMDVSKDVGAALFLRLGGTRDFALAAGPLVTDGRAKTQMLKIAAACDLGDLLAVGIAHRRGKISALSAWLFAVASLGCLALSVKGFSER